MHEGFNAHDAAKMVSALTDDCVDFDYGTGEGHSKAEYETAIGHLFAAFPDAKYGDEPRVEEGQRRRHGAQRGRAR